MYESSKMLKLLNFQYEGHGFNPFLPRKAAMQFLRWGLTNQFQSVIEKEIYKILTIYP